MGALVGVFTRRRNRKAGREKDVLEDSLREYGPSRREQKVRHRRGGLRRERDVESPRGERTRLPDSGMEYD